jgi:hypothetical protein
MGTSSSPSMWEVIEVVIWANNTELGREIYRLIDKIVLTHVCCSGNESEMVEKAVWLAEHIGTFPMKVLLSTLSKLA